MDGDFRKEIQRKSQIILSGKFEEFPKGERSPEKIIKDFQWVESCLSPENLHCDGECSRAQAMRKYRNLNKYKKALIKELGRIPTDKEIWGF